MEKIKVEEILVSTKGKLVCGDENTVFYSISTDTRTLKKGDLFIALKGKNFDGNKFIPEAIKRGAGGIIVSSRSIVHGLKSVVVVEVRNTLRALQDIANFYRRRFDIPLIAITGSNGKTTTKEMAWSVLSQKFSVLKNKGNFNNEVGVPLTIFELNSNHQAAVLEIASNAEGEIERLTEVVNPTIGVITNIGMTHTQGLKNIAGVAREKFSLIRGLPENGTAVLNFDDERIRTEIREIIKRRKLKIFTYGIENRGNVYAGDIKLEGEKSSFTLYLGNKPIRINLKSPGIFNIYNALTAASVGHVLGVSSSLIKRGLEENKSLSMRMNLCRSGGILLINDAYNANPSSARAAISFLKGLDAKRKLFVLGDMLELGRYSVSAHRETGKDIVEADIDILFTLGELASITYKEIISKGGTAFSFKNKTELINKLVKELKNGDAVLIKGSRLMKMEEVVQELESRIKEYRRV